MARLQRTNAKAFLKKAEDEVNEFWKLRRVSYVDVRRYFCTDYTKCDVLVASFDASVLRSTGIEILNQLWGNDISAELAIDSRSPEDLLSKYRDDQHYWIVIIKQDSILKIKTVGKKEIQDVDIPMSQLLSWLANEIRDRDQRDGISERIKLARNQSQIHPNSVVENEQEVRLLVAQTKSKKNNRRNIVEQAQNRTASLVQSFLDGPILAIETTDNVMDLIRGTRLSDADSWWKVSQSVTAAEKRYIGEIHDVIKNLALQNKDRTRNAFIYNFRTGGCIYYDLGA
jgi:translation initiation factor 2-alpha kinase 4